MNKDEAAANDLRVVILSYIRVVSKELGLPMPDEDVLAYYCKALEEISSVALLSEALEKAHKAHIYGNRLPLPGEILAQYEARRIPGAPPIENWEHAKADFRRRGFLIGDEAERAITERKARKMRELEQQSQQAQLGE